MKTREEFKKELLSLSKEEKKEILRLYQDLAEKCMITYNCDDPNEAVGKWVKTLEGISKYAMKRYNLPSGKAIKRFFEELKEKEEAILKLKEKGLELREEIEDRKMLAKSLKRVRARALKPKKMRFIV